MNHALFNVDEMKLKEMPMVDIAYEILKKTKNNYNFQDLVNEIVNIKELTDEEMQQKLAQLYTEINIDGRFIHLGQNEWGLKNWYPDQQMDAYSFGRDDEEEEEDFEEEEDYETFNDEEDIDQVEDEDLEDEEEEMEDDVEDDVEDEVEDEVEDDEEEDYDEEDFDESFTEEAEDLDDELLDEELEDEED